MSFAAAHSVLWSPYAIAQSVSHASGHDGRQVELFLVEARRDLLRSEALNGVKNSTIAELDRMYSEAQFPNWDGEDGLPISRATYSNACRLIQNLPQNWPQPRIGVDPDGEFAIEWSKGPRCRLSVSVGDDDVISYAWLLGSEQSHGTNAFLDEIPTGLAVQVNRILQS